MVIQQELSKYDKPDPSINVSVVIPCYYSAETLTTLSSKIIESCNLIASNLEIIYVDDGSKDRTWQVISDLSMRDSRIRWIRLSKNFGQHKAIMAGLRECRYEYIVVMDGDMQDDPAQIPKLISKAKDSGAEVVLAKRIRKQHTFLKKFGSKLFSKLFSFMTGVQRESEFGNFGVYSRKVINEVKSFGDKDFLLGNLVTWSGFSSAHIDVEHNARLHGKSTYSFWALVKLAYSVIISHSNFPLRFIVFLGSVVSLLSFSLALIVLSGYFFRDETPLGWTSMIIAILISTGILLISIGIVGLYIGRIFDSTKQRPLYIVSDRTYCL